MSQTNIVTDRFQIEQLAGSGGTGVVFRAVDRRNGARVALKLLARADERTRTRFLREAAVLAGLSHPGIVRYVEHGVTEENEPYLAIEWLDGQDLAERLRRGRLSVRDTVRLAGRVADALAHAHGAGVLHRDVKPSNLLLVGGEPGRVKVVDFGLARAGDPRGVTRAGALLGTPGYAAPEQARGDVDVDGRVDVFGLGCVLFECLTGRPAFLGGAGEATVTYRSTTADADVGFIGDRLAAELARRPPARAPRPREIDPSIPAELDDLVTHMLEPLASARVPEMRVVCERLRELAAPEEDARTEAPPEAAGERVDVAGGGGALLAGKYRIESEIGSGGSGVVLRATHVGLGQTVAVKMLNESWRGRPEVVARFVREARAAARLRSPHVVRVQDVGFAEDGAPFLVMEYLSGADLAATLSERGPLPIDEVVDCVLQACEALAEAHAAGIVHRDLKPANLFVEKHPDGSRSVKLLDFGISKFAEATTAVDAAVTREGEHMGSPQYMSPEQIVSASRVDARTDVWSMGVVLYELLSGKPPFMGRTVMQLAVAIREDAPVALRELRPEAPAALEAVVARCLSKDPAGRPADAAELAEALKVASGRSRGSIAARPTSSEDGTTVSLQHGAKPAARGTPRRWTRALALGAALALTAGLVAMTLRPDRLAGAPAPAPTASAVAPANIASGGPAEAVPGVAALVAPSPTPASAEHVPAPSARASASVQRPEKMVRAPVVASASAAPIAAPAPSHKVFNEPIE
jgi:serine/threonine-protein kinase